MSSPITSSDFENQTPGQSLCDAFQEKLLNNAKLREWLDYFFKDPEGTFASGFMADIVAAFHPIGSYKFMAFPMASSQANPNTGLVWLECNGQKLLQADYPTLFSVIGTTFNVDGDNNALEFRVPDFGGRFPLGRNGSYAAAAKGGEETVVLTPEQGPPHQHKIFTTDRVNTLDGAAAVTDLLANSYVASSTTLGSQGNNSYVAAASDDGVPTVGISGVSGGVESDATDSTEFTGYDNKFKAQAHNNMPPYLACVVYILAGYRVNGDLA
jgi:microcystin-dependent protein